ncbi:hypothetical protein A3A93_01200 [Candidatus Roizmanbacteria bacterium RIFCSPLOWO2_01_FULL_38_12]|uniref:Chorismate mutase domain-containing protein n=1 Tax=Candidatus Roizmanbacteria bacterium RIFCSPLOWO2_01_FULL_38_12 TaxID=1802061 RepID=A0A1F7IR32_9BACT|nr:MAG: hypothetical protein A3F59_03015 [Candidatus Roizmanbacteria bacterium RIFCSPHIGHO2_12_FULL_38_13]OGK45815.1 MAG: hypothetical protein A3A93_01200 [Candidatus Roizmanbacteria bacterium RIFCSPLOWO2_01_FULL_38_12]
MKKKLKSLRKQIDFVDGQIIELLAKRFSIVQEIGAIKKSSSKKPLDKKRWEKLISNRLKLAKGFNLDKNFVQDVWKRIHRQSLIIESDHEK